jgi:CDP-paratose 2-epimerase
MKQKKKEKSFSVNKMSKRILITGGAGFVGSNLADSFLSQGNDVIVFDNLMRKGVEKNIKWLQDNHKKNLSIVKKDIRDYDVLKKSIQDVDFVFHTAAQVAVTTSVKNPREDFEINALGTFNVLDAARNSNLDPIIIYTSTNKVYGNNVNDIHLIEKEKRYEFSDKNFRNGIPENFSTDADEHTPYGCSKYAGDLYMRDFHDIFGLKTVTFRMSCIYGLHQYGNEDQGWVAYFTISSVLGKPIVLYGNGKQVRDVLFIDDLVRGFELASDNINKTKGKAYNIGGGPENTISLLELLNMLEEFGLKPKYSFGDWRPADQKVYISDIRKAMEFKWKPQISPREGVKKLLNWIEANKNLFV